MGTLLAYRAILWAFNTRLKLRTDTQLKFMILNKDSGTEELVLKST